MLRTAYAVDAHKSGQTRVDNLNFMGRDRQRRIAINSVLH